MKTYTVYYIIKQNRHGYLRNETVEANNQKEAIKAVREQVREKTGRNAFSATCKEPVKIERGLEFQGSIYTRYCEYDNSLW